MSLNDELSRRELAKNYAPEEIEGKWYKYWQEVGFFHEAADATRPSYSITIPPPNITGSLHMGHALNNSILDTMTRWHRMRGYNTLCLPGTDHASIATQAVVERELAKQGIARQDLGREAFIEKCWEWREVYGTRIYHQFERLGCSYDWERARFTMDESYVDAIMKCFEDWYERGLIYRGTRVVNWDVKLQSAVSEIEVYTETRQGKLYHFRYPFADGSGSVVIATTRPETLLGDTAVAANPADERYQPHFGKMLALPLTNREIPLIADDYAKPEFGSGAVKVTPAHDFNDFECGRRNNLPQIIVIGKDGKMTEASGEKYVGLDRYAARKQVVADMEELGLLEKIEDYTIQTPISDRSKEVIEPLLSEQWFADMKSLAEPAIRVAEQDKIRFFPERYKAIYLHWMENILPWCISRQLWWGHRIPVWWTEEGGKRRHAFARTQEEAVAKLGTENCWQDEDVLDTWFSSGLWPHATLGWPSGGADLETFYPTDLLSTAQEILYLWVARMIMTGLDFVQRDDAPESVSIPHKGSRAVIPFKAVYIHATVLDAKGERMSKSKGNGVDPIDLIEKFGADATRFSLLQQAGMNQDIRYSEGRTELARSFCTKLWNASRFVMMNLDDSVTGELPAAENLTSADRWILSRLNATIGEVNKHLATYDMDDATRALYRFLWDDYCDWYLEMAKPRLRSEGEARSTIQNMLVFVLETALRLLHPMIPFITEEIWQVIPHQGETICLAPYPQVNPAWDSPEATAAIETTIEATRALRNLKAELNIPPGTRLQAVAVVSRPEVAEALVANAPLIQELARLSEPLAVSETAPQGGKWVGTPITGAEILLEIGDTLDMGKELERIEKELQSIAKEIARCEGKLGNPSFIERANAEVVAVERQRLNDWREKQGQLEARKRLFAGG